MAEEEHFSLCWNNFNTNLSTGFHESLCRGDLVDVTLVAEGKMVKAHRLVLSVCSPLFREMFAVMPANQHAFVVLKDVTHTALQDLITFIYCGEVNVKNEALSTFISTAESLQIKGLTDNETKHESQEIVSQIVINQPTAIPVATTRTVIPQRTVRAKPQPQIVEKVEEEDSSAEERVPVVATKRVASVVAKSGTVKRLKTNSTSTPTATPTAPAIKASSRQATASLKTEQDLIELPAADTLSTDEPIETEEPQESIIEEEEEQYEMKYEDSYFTETEDQQKSTTMTTTFQDQSTEEVAATDAQERAIFTRTTRGREQVIYHGQPFLRDKEITMVNGKTKRIWRCNRWWSSKCRARIYTIDNLVFPLKDLHTHAEVIKRKKRVVRSKDE